MRPLLVIALKDIRLLLRDRGACFFTFLFPVMIGIFFGTIFAGGTDEKPRRVAVALVDEDRSTESVAFAERLARCGHFDITTVPSRQEGVTLVRLGSRSAVVALPAGFGAASERLFAGQATPIALGTDPSRAAEAAMIRGLLTEQAFARLSSLFADTARMKNMARSSRAQVKALRVLAPRDGAAVDRFYTSLDTMLDSLDALPDRTAEPRTDEPGAAPAATGPAFNPVSITPIEVQPAARPGPRNAYAVTFAQAIMWGVIGCCSGFAVSLLSERNSGTLIRLRLAPLGWTRLLAAKALGCFFTTCLVGALMILIAVGAFAVRPVSWTMLVVGMLCVALSFVGIMMLLAVLGRRTGSGQIGWAVMLVLTMVGGGTIPLFAMPRWLQNASGISPVKWGILAVEGGLWRGFSPAEMALPCAILLAVGAAGFALGAWLFSRDQGD